MTNELQRFNSCNVGPIRRTICLVCALGLSGAGLYLLSLLLTAERFLGKVALAGSGLLALGLYWLWADFINADPRPDN